MFLVTNGTNYTTPNFTGWSKKEVNTYFKVTGITHTEEGNGYVISQSVPEGTLITNEMGIHIVFKPKYEEANTNEEPEVIE